LTDGGFFKGCKKIGDDGITEVAPPKINKEKPEPVKVTPAAKKAPKKKSNEFDTVKRQLQEAEAILETLNERGIHYQERIDCLQRLVRATDILRCMMPEDDPGADDELETLVVVWKERGYYMEQTEFGIKIVLPPVLPKKERDSNVALLCMEKKYSNEDIGRFIAREKKELGIEADFLQDQVLVFTHERVKKGNFDYDNLSTSAYINAIADGFLAADNATNIDFFQRFVRGEENRTIVHIIPRENFAKWVKSRY